MRITTDEHPVHVLIKSSMLPLACKPIAGLLLHLNIIDRFWMN